METYHPHNYQKEASQFICDTPRCGLFLDAGLGKTAATFDAIVSLKNAGLIKKVIIIAPLRVIQGVWQQEAAKWEQFNHLTFAVLHGKGKDKAFDSDADIYLLNYDGLKWFRARMKKHNPHFDMLVLDESTAVKSTTTQRFRNLKVLLQHFKRRVILTGTPAPNSLLDLFGQIFILDKGRALGRNLGIHRTLFWDVDPYNPYDWMLKPGAEKEIIDLIAPMVKRMSSEMYLDLPELIIQDILVTLPPNVQKIYDAVEEDYFSDLEEGVIAAANAAVASGKLRQIASGAVYDENEKVNQLHSVKVQAVVDMVEQCGAEPVMVMYEFNHELQNLRTVFPDAPVIRGGISATYLDDVCRRWNTGEIPVLLVQPQSASHGLNLQGGGRHMIWTTLTWSGERYIQSMHRVHRQGQTQTVFIHRIIANQTIDLVVRSTLSSKEENQTNFLQGVYDYRKNKNL